MKIIMTKGEISAAKGLMDKLGIDSSVLSLNNIEMETKYASIKIEGDEVTASVSPEYYKDIIVFATEAAVGIENLPWTRICKRIGLRFFARLAKAWQELVKSDIDSALEKFLDTPEVEALVEELGKKADAIEQKWE